MDNTLFLEFLDTTGTQKEFVNEINTFLLDHDCKCDIKTAKSGFTVSYILPEIKKTLATFVCRKTGIKLRIYPQNLGSYERFLDTLPAKMKKEIIKSSVCKRLINPDDCNPRCIMGYDFVMDGERYRKCRYMAFMPTLTTKATPISRPF